MMPMLAELMMRDQILDELIIAGELQESSKKAVLRIVSLPVSPILRTTFSDIHKEGPY